MKLSLASARVQLRCNMFPSSTPQKLIVGFAFRELQLHRLEATCMPENEASLKLLRSLGFREIGLTKSYMKINGKWADHFLFEKFRED